MKAASAFLLSLAMALPAQQIHAQISDNEVRIGLISDMTGPYLQVGHGAEIGAEMAIEDFGGEVLGKKIRLLTRDHQVDADLGMRHAKELVEEHNVDALLEMVGSHIAIPIQHYARQQNVAALHIGSASSALTGEHCSPTGVHWAYDTHALAAGTASALSQAGARTWFFITTQAPFALSLQADATAVIEREGGEVIGVAPHAFGEKDYTSQLLEAQASGADVIALASAGEDTLTTLRQAYEMGIPDETQTLVGLLVNEDMPRDLGLYVAAGLQLTTAHYWNFDEKTREWGARYLSRAGVVSSMYPAATYSVVTHYLKAIEAAGTDDAATVVAKMRELPIDDFYARNAHLRPDGRLILDIYLAQIKSPRESQAMGDYYNIVDVIPGNEAFRTMEDGNCPHL